MDKLSICGQLFIVAPQTLHPDASVRTCTSLDPPLLPHYRPFQTEAAATFQTHQLVTRTRTQALERSPFLVQSRI
ncbi:hypothetical protein L596_026779 [Steinernema carpocapsae]|uniref:Uncharacterized protein n=1 Tax=Steinernema carpocapsae TaxID=34508 RepID=A0A4V5ZYA8_STECR|nr:hypothetical protein L596_026779 [Steinernema carpocapsae]